MIASICHCQDGRVTSACALPHWIPNMHAALMQCQKENCKVPTDRCISARLSPTELSRHSRRIAEEQEPQDGIKSGLGVVEGQPNQQRNMMRPSQRVHAPLEVQLLCHLYSQVLHDWVVSSCSLCASSWHTLSTAGRLVCLASYKFLRHRHTRRAYTCFSYPFIAMDAPDEEICVRRAAPVTRMQLLKKMGPPPVSPEAGRPAPGPGMQKPAHCGPPTCSWGSSHPEVPP